MVMHSGRVCRGLVALLGLWSSALCAAPDLALRMSVSPVVPAPAQPAEFTVVVTNAGGSAANDVVVTDRLPVGLVIPSGMAAFPSAGSYDPLTGAWSLGALIPGASATLVIPAVVVAIPQPPCIVNVATVSLVTDSNSSNDRAVAAVKTGTAVRCVDLAIIASGGNLHGCGDGFELKYWVTVSNGGPDDAGSFYLDMEQTPAIIPGLKFTGADCEGLRCSAAALPAGTSMTFDAKSGSLDFNNRKYVTLDFALSSVDIDYDTANNQQADPISIPPTPDCTSGGSGGSSGCFIATAAYGSALEPHVVALREFRDRVLRQSALGRAFIRYYYRYSPPLAAIIARHESLRVLARAVLTPIVLAVEFPRAAGALVGFALLLLVRRFRRSRRATWSQ